MSRVAIRSTGLTSPGGTVVEVDGHNIVAACRGLDLHIRAGHPPLLTLDLLTRRGIDVETDALVIVPEATRDALVALGWTPPEEAVTHG